MVKMMFKKNAPEQPTSRKTPKGGKMTATMILIMSAQTIVNIEVGELYGICDGYSYISN